MSENEKTDLSEKTFDPNGCSRCGNIIKKKFSLFGSRKDCFICNKNFCQDCLTKEERLEISTGRRGYACLDCYPKTKMTGASSLIPGVIDLNPAVEAIENLIPQQLDSISSRLDEIVNVKDELSSLKDEVEKVRKAFYDLMDLIKFEVDDVKAFSQLFTQRNWQLIRKDIYKILLFSGIGIIILTGILTFEILLIIRIFSQFF